MSPHVINDDPASAYPLLQQFLGGYFHEDWVIDRDGWKEVVDDFTAESSAQLVEASAGELRRLLEARLDETELADVVGSLGCSVDPAAFGLTHRRWLDAVLERLAHER